MRLQDQPSIKSALFVPGSRPERFAKALASGADCVIVDFEDAVEEALKERARENLGTYLQANPQASVVVRINAAGHAQHMADIAFCGQYPGVSAVLLAKAESREQVERVSAAGKPVWALIESAQGLVALEQIAHAPNLERLTFGALDLGLDLGLRSGSAAASRLLDQARYALLVQTATAGLARPLDTVFPDIGNPDGLAEFAQDARDMGFGGMLCIHPGQVAAVNQVFAPTEAQILWARKVLEAAKGAPGAFRFEGQMIDAPVLSEARRLLREVG